MKVRAKRIAKYYNQCKLPKWATVLGVVLLAFGIVAAGVTAIFHDNVSFTNFCTINSIGKDDPRRPERAVLVEVDFQSIHGKTDKSRAH